jgi:hypothetical protein
MKTEEITLEQAALAWAQGKRVEALRSQGEGWGLICPLGSENGKFSVRVIESAGGVKFRLAPEPPAKKFRPWTPEEVPVGAILRTARTGQPFRWMIVAVCSDGITTCGGKTCVTQSHEIIMATCEHSLDNGKTWLPCGVEVLE